MTDVLADQAEIPGSVMSAAEFLNSAHLDDFIAKISSGDTITTPEGIVLPTDEWFSVAPSDRTYSPEVPTVRDVEIACLEVVHGKAERTRAEIVYTFGDKQNPMVTQPGADKNHVWQADKFLRSSVSSPRAMISIGQDQQHRIPDYDERRIPGSSIIVLTVAGDTPQGTLWRQARFFLEWGVNRNLKKPSLLVWRTRDTEPTLETG